MPVLFVNGCVRDESRTLRLAATALECLGKDVVQLDLAAEGIEPLRAKTLAIRDAAVHSGSWDHPVLRYARQFAQAEEIMIAAPFWDLGFPALLKSYMEAVTVSGVTFRYVDGVPHGLCSAKRLIYVTTAGGPVFADFGFPYIKTLAEAFLGIPEVLCFRAENLDMIGADVENILAGAETRIRSYFADT